MSICCLLNYYKVRFFLESVGLTRLRLTLKKEGKRNTATIKTEPAKTPVWLNLACCWCLSKKKGKPKQNSDAPRSRWLLLYFPVETFHTKISYICIFNRLQKKVQMVISECKWMYSLMEKNLSPFIEHKKNVELPTCTGQILALKKSKLFNMKFKFYQTFIINH